MAKKATGKSSKKKSGPRKTKKVKTSQIQEQAGGAAQSAASQRFVNDLLVRNEAAELDQQGKLPLHATHVIKGKKPDGTPLVERVRFKAF